MLFGYSSANAAFLNSPHKGEHVDVQMETVGRRDPGWLGGCKRLVASSFPKISSCTIEAEQGAMLANKKGKSFTGGNSSAEPLARAAGRDADTASRGCSGKSAGWMLYLFPGTSLPLRAGSRTTAPLA